MRGGGCNLGGSAYAKLVSMEMFQSPQMRGGGCNCRNSSRITQRLGFNPLKCGVVVATYNIKLTRDEFQSFNPLKCGVVVATPI